MTLNDRYIRFCELYLTCKNAKQAYLEAGFEAASDRTAETGASKLLGKPEIQAYLNTRRQALREQTDTTLAETVQQLKWIAAARITDFLSWKDGEGQVIDQSVEIDIELHQKEAALKLLSSYYGIDSDFDKAVSTLQRYGLFLKQDADQPSGWRVDRE